MQLHVITSYLSSHSSSLTYKKSATGMDVPSTSIPVISTKHFTKFCDNAAALGLIQQQRKSSTTSIWKEALPKNITHVSERWVSGLHQATKLPKTRSMDAMKIGKNAFTCLYKCLQVKYIYSSSFFNSFVYVYNHHQREYEFYKVFELSEDGKTCKAKRMITGKELLPFLGGCQRLQVDLETVGVYCYQYLDNDFTYLQTNDLHGKAIRIMNYVMSISKNVLLEATWLITSDNKKKQLNWYWMTMM